MNSMFSKTIFTAIIFVTFFSSAFSQSFPPDFSNDVSDPFESPLSSGVSCSNTLANTSTDFVNKYRTMATWIPVSSTPVKTIQIAMHVFTGTNSLSNTTSDINWLNAVVNQMNYDLANICQPGLPSFASNPIIDTKVRFELVNIYFYNNSPYYNSSNSSGMLSYIAGIDANRLNYLPILIPISGSGTQHAATPFPSYISAGSTATDLYFSNQFAYVPADNTLNWTFYTVLKHELGHCMDLLHTYQPSCCHEDCQPSVDYISDIFGSAPNPNCWLGGGWNCNPNTNSPPACTDNWMGGWSGACYLSPMQIGKIHRAMSIKTLRKYVKDVPLPTTNYNITTNETWDFDVRWYGDIYVKANTTLTIKCKVLMGTGSKIVVERGGNLIIDGGSITSATNAGWEGIEVWGNTTQSQHTPNAQGQLIIKNGAVIENAHEAITTIKTTTNGFDWSYTGGIVKCTNASFINCRRAAQFLTYRNFNPNFPATTLPNLSYFRQCNFITNSSFNYSVYNAPYAFVSMLDVAGIKFLGCNFKNNEPNTLSPSMRGKGIVSIDAKYYIDDDGTVPSVFEDLWYGVDASASNPLNTQTIINTDFLNNYKGGVILNGINYATLVGNNFVVNPIYVLSYGLYLNACSYYQVENNQFSAVNGLATVGMYINNSGKPANIIYNNTFTDLSGGTIAQNINDGPGLNNGLRINCNDYGFNFVDVCVLGSVQGSKIGLVQGTCSNTGQTATRNTYSAVCNNGENQYYVDQNVVTQQIYHAGFNGFPITDPVCHDPLVISSICNSTFNKTSECPGFINCNPTCQRIIISSNETDINNLQVAILAGAAASLINSINSNMSNGNLKNLLLSKSPYLSDAVLIAYLNRANTPPAGHIKEVVVANSPVSNAVMEVLNSMNLPNGIRNQINAAQVGVSSRTQLENQIAITQSNIELATDYIIRYFLNDTSVVGGIDSVLSILSTLNREDVLCQKAGAYIVNANYTDAEQLLNSLITANPDDEFCQLLLAITSLKQTIAGCATMHIDTAITVIITELAAHGELGTCVNAQTLLKYVFEQEFPEETLFPFPQNNLRYISPTETVNQKNENSLICFPNPTSGLITVQISAENAGPFTIQLFNQMGQNVFEKRCFLNNNILDLSSLTNGLYFVKVNNSNSVLLSKIIIQ